MSLPAELLLLAWLLLSILSTGLMVVHRFLRMRGLDLIVYGVGAGIVVHGLFGLWIALVAHYHRQITGLLICLALGAIVYLWRQKVIVDLAKDLSGPIKIFLGIWIAFVVTCLAITHLEVRWPDTLPDGQFVFKTHTTNVKIQLLTTLPSDNSIPFVVQEYLLRRIPFRQEHPLLPFTEVTERTLLLPLVGLPFRAAMDPPPPYRNALPKFHYGSQDWPKTEVLYSESGFRAFLTISIALNALVLLGAGLFCANLGFGAVLPIAAIVCMTNHYFIAQTIFTWPKAFAGFFIALAWDAFRGRRDPVLAGLCSALAYHCHPYALAFLVGIGTCYLINGYANDGWRNIVRFVAIIALLLMPWVIWTRFVVSLPSIMLSHNSFPGGTDAIFPNPLWVRVNNIFRTFVPVVPTIYPFDLKGVVSSVHISLPGVAGLIVFWPGIKSPGCFSSAIEFSVRRHLFAGHDHYSPFWFSKLSDCDRPAGRSSFADFSWCSAHARSPEFRDIWILVGAQLVLNVGLVFANAYLVGAH